LRYKWGAVQYVTFQEKTKSSSLSKSSLDKAIVK
jgi:hypothetical protein